MYRWGSLSPFPCYLTLPGKMFCFPYPKASPFLTQANRIPGLLTLTSMLKMEASYSSQNITHARFQIVTVVRLLDPHTWKAPQSTEISCTNHPMTQPYILEGQNLLHDSQLQNCLPFILPQGITSKVDYLK
jgi:hypothetical protein